MHTIKLLDAKIGNKSKWEPPIREYFKGKKKKWT